jgi:hypothetical protein
MEVAWIMGRLPRGLMRSKRALQWHWVGWLDDGFLGKGVTNSGEAVGGASGGGSVSSRTKSSSDE